MLEKLAYVTFFALAGACLGFGLYGSVQQAVLGAGIGLLVVPTLHAIQHVL